MVATMITVSFGPFDLLAVLGAVTGVAALAWQVFTWRRLSHRVRVTMAYSIPVYDDGPTFRDDDQICITASNAGTSAVTVTGWAIRVKGGQNGHVTRPYVHSAPVPHRLEPGSEVSFYYPVGALREYHETTGYPYRKIKAWVRLATRQQIFSRKGVPLR